MKLTPRLKKIARFVEHGSKIIDVGTDHGYVPAYLILKNIVTTCIASDINEGPLNAANETLLSLGMENKVSLRLGSGLDVVNRDDNLDTVVIAGMGGETIISILSNRPAFMRKFTLILQPMTEVTQVRQYLKNDNWEIVDEEIAQENMRFYEIIKAEKTFKVNDYTRQQLRFGPILLKKRSKEFIVYLQRQMMKNKIIMDNMVNGKGTEEKVKEILNENYQIEEVLKEIESSGDYSGN